MFAHGLKKEQIISGYELRNIFKVSNMGGMRKSNTYNILVLISHQENNKLNIYNDRWEGNILYYTGEGQQGDQTLSRQNKTLYNSNKEDIEIFLFEVLKQKEYTYKGKVKLDGEVKIEEQPDKNNIMRKVYIFPLKLVE